MKWGLKRFLTHVAATVWVAQLASAAAAYAGQPSPAAMRAYNDYLHHAEARMAEDYLPSGNFLSKELLSGPNATAELKAGDAVVRCVAGCGSRVEWSFLAGSFTIGSA